MLEPLWGVVKESFKFFTIFVRMMKVLAMDASNSINLFKFFPNIAMDVNIILAAAHTKYGMNSILTHIVFPMSYITLPGLSLIPRH